MTDPALLRLRAIEKSYPGVRALRGVDFELRRGEVHALLGENGAGKSTLVRIVAGAVRPDQGGIEVAGRDVEFRSPVDSERAGIAVMHQEFSLVPALSVRANLFLGRGPTLRRLNHRAERQQARELLSRLGSSLDPDTPVGSLRVAEQQTVEIARALACEARILVMDEPTAALSAPEVEQLLALLDELRGTGIGIVYISHRLEEIEKIADRVTVLRDGARAHTGAVAETGRETLIEHMVGRSLEQEFPPRTHRPREVRLVVRDLRREPQVRGVSFELRAGEVLGVTGLVGAGRTELARLLFGADHSEGGSIQLDGETLRLRRPQDAIDAGICLLTEDRKNQGLILDLSALENFGLPNLRRFSRGGWIRRGEERAAFAQAVDQLGIKLSDPDQAVRTLSGGNQQKVVLAKWLQQDARVLIFDEPTRGVDVGAKYEIHTLIDELAADGKSLLVISSELPEILGLSDRIMVMHEGRVAGFLENDGRLRPEQILELALGEPTRRSPRP